MARVLVRLVGVVLCAILGFVTAGSCGSSSEDIEIAMGSSPRNLGPDATPEELAEVVTGNTDFGLELAATLRASQDSNLMIAPTNIATALAMTWAGARDATADEMAATLHFPLDPERLHNAFNALDQALAARNSDRVTLQVANALWAQSGYEVRAEFLETLAVHYGAPVYLLDFKANPTACRVAINDWVSDQTEDHIPDLLPDDAISALTRFVLTSAIYFKADKTEPGPFYLVEGGEVTVKKMDRAGDFPYAAGAGWQAVDLAYEGDQLSMVVVLPDMGQFAAFEAATSGAQVQSVFAGLEVRKVHLSLPKFSFKNKLSLKEALKSLGMVQAFEVGLSDFSGMVPPTSSDGKSLSIAGVYHDTFITVDEEGTEAGAATGVVVNVQSDSGVPDHIELDVDRPFLFFIRDVQTGAVLFAGRVVDPTAS